MKPGDVVFVVKIEDHPIFKREGNHLIMKKTISLTESLTGLEFELPHLDGRKIIVKSDPGAVIKPGELKIVRGQGMPIHRRIYDFGNLFIKFDVKFPDRLSSEQVSGLLNILPKKETVKRSIEHEEEFSIETPDMEADAAGAEEEDEDDGARGGGVQCAQQ